MRTSGPGNRPVSGRRSGRSRLNRDPKGFTLLELLVVVAVIALAAGVSVLALRDGSSQRLDQEAVRLAALLEAARMESRSSGRTITWAPQSAADRTSGFRFGARDGAPLDPTLQRLPGHWLHQGTNAEVIGQPRIVLGPDPILLPQRIRLSQGRRELIVSTDGLGPFRVDEGAAKR